ncbi:MAG: NAD(P)H-binding protein [Asticcacaulis sp.]
MKILITGANGFIGSALAAALQSDGHEIVRVVRPRKRLKPGPGVSETGVFEIDMVQATRPEDWFPLLDGVEAVINCVGTLQDSARDNTQAAHLDGPSALFHASQRRGIRRVIHFSALGVDSLRPTPFSQTKYQGDEILSSLDLDWVILRPSVVLGGNVFGASALIRGLALPLYPVMPDTGPLQVVTLEDVVRTVRFFVDPQAPGRLTLELAGPERQSFDDLVATYRRWLGWRPAKGFSLPRPVAKLFYGLGDMASTLGWRPAVRGTAGIEMQRGAAGDPGPWTEVTGRPPTRLEAALSASPAGVQERWFARAYFIKPLVFVVLPLFWIGTGIISLTSGWERGVQLMAVGGGGPVVCAQCGGRCAGRHGRGRGHCLQAVSKTGALWCHCPVRLLCAVGNFYPARSVERSVRAIS